MKFEYKSVTGTVAIDVDEEWVAILEDLDRQEYNNDHKETRRHYHLEACEYEGDTFAAEDPDAQTGVLSFTLDALGAEETGERLGAMGFAVRAGLHCSPLAHKTVGTLKTGTVRVSPSYFNTPAEIDAFLNAVNTLARGLK